MERPYTFVNFIQRPTAEAHSAQVFVFFPKKERERLFSTYRLFLSSIAVVATTISVIIAALMISSVSVGIASLGSGATVGEVVVGIEGVVIGVAVEVGAADCDGDAGPTMMYVVSSEP